MKFVTLIFAFMAIVASIAGVTPKFKFVTPISINKNPSEIPILMSKKIAMPTAISTSLSNPISSSFINNSDSISYNLAPKSVDQIKEERCMAYIAKYALIAKKESNISNIPYSIIMAQALIESNAGISAISIKNKNHFGQKCLERSCPKGHCSNFTDDSHKDFFRIFNSVEESYASHTRLLQKYRYKRLFDFPKEDYISLAKGLHFCGYATDKQYAQKLIGIIEKYKLNK